MASIEYTERQRIEKRYHDEKYRESAIDKTQRRTDRASQRFWETVGRPNGLTILDFGCGNGWLSVALAKQGNRVHGFDISSVLVQSARQMAEASNVGDRATFMEMAAENLDYPDQTFDMVIGESILHHTDLDVALQRMRAVLKHDGRAIFLEPLNQNIALKIWRALTPWRRTRTERAFTRQDIASVRKAFPATRFSYYAFASMFTTGLLMLAPRSRILCFIHKRFEDFDECLLAAFPSLGRFSAVTIMDMRK
jgi:2-polyprenyl-3-methyl-5-hydroxy-6-metoxy-1,4-benzoquinol methylase